MSLAFPRLRAAKRRGRGGGRLALPRLAALGAVAGAAAYLLVELVPDIHSKPLFEDESVSGLIGARPFGEIVATTMWDRGGAPLHFLLVHAAFLADASPETLRWISVVFAVGTVLVCYDLGRRLDGRAAGVAAAIVAAGSGMLAVYGSFGRMYALFAFAAALAVDLFVRCLDRPTTRTVAAASAAAWLLPAVHPYGGIVVAVEAAVALAVWRGRPLRPAWPAALAVLAMAPFAVADLRLADRFEVSSGQSGRLATWDEARHQLEDALRGFGGGSGWTLVVLLALAAAGLLILTRRRPALVAWALVAFVGPPLLSTLVRTGRAPDLSPRHLIFALPFFAAFVGVAVARLPARPLALAGLAVVAALSTQGIHDPRSITYTAALGSEEAVAAPAAWLRENVQPDDVLYPYSSVFLAALPEAGEARGLPRAQTQSLLAALDRVDYPASAVFIAIPIGTTEVHLSEFQTPSRDLRVVPFRSWLLIRAAGPFYSEAAVLGTIADVLTHARSALHEPAPAPLAGWFELNLSVVCKALAKRGSNCGTE
ncbi:MAG TPA: glycosyltransferase family 39 protein [Gaiellaceae bacterium]|nr:glycosyltransferase family 39 protein [Gaiellaceae bacterium]